MKLFYLPAALLLLLLPSCTIYREYSIEVYKPGKLLVPPGIENAAVVYRNFKYPADTLQHFYKKGAQLIKANDRQNLDSLLINACLNEFAFHLKNNKVFNEVPVLPYPTFEKHTRENLTDLPPEIVGKLTSDAEAGILISLETFSAFFSTYPATSGLPLTNEAVTVAVWGIYYPGKKIPAVRSTLIDTIFWDGYDSEGNLDENYSPPPRSKALEIAAAMAGESFARYFYASWHTEKRMYSIPPLPDFSEAALYIEEGKWDEAIALYKRYVHDRNGKMAIDARYNMALAYEMKDEPETAQQWLTAAHTLAKTYRSKNNLQMIQLYQQALEKRKKEVATLDRINKESRP